MTDFYSRELAQRDATIAQQADVIEQLVAQQRASDDANTKVKVELTQALREAEAGARAAEERIEKLTAKRRLPKGARAVIKVVFDLMHAQSAGFRAAKEGTPAHELYVAWRFLAMQPPPALAGVRHFLNVAKVWASAYEMEPDPSDDGAKLRMRLYRAVQALEVVTITREALRGSR